MRLQFKYSTIQSHETHLNEVKCWTSNGLAWQTRTVGSPRGVPTSPSCVPCLWCVKFRSQTLPGKFLHPGQQGYWTQVQLITVEVSLLLVRESGWSQSTSGNPSCPISWQSVKWESFEPTNPIVSSQLISNMKHVIFIPYTSIHYIKHKEHVNHRCFEDCQKKHFNHIITSPKKK